jgi:Pyruvate/2-oxoacid:ferredoxin oxidoreductase delta subunit
MKTARSIVRIDESKCDGCGLCATACAEGAIAIVDGKAKLVKDQYCDGLGACLGHCPKDAITIETREADAFDAAAVNAAKAASQPKAAAPHGHAGCPGMALRNFKRAPETPAAAGAEAPSQLCQWPVQLRLVPVNAPYWQGADILIAADCTAFALGAFHAKLLKGRSVAIACPKLDETEGYVEKLTAIFKGNAVKSVTVARMEVPCCAGLLRMARAAYEASGSTAPFADVVVGIEGGILSETTNGH